ncbi:MAG: hypothetical protein ACOCXA_09115 [Planctomycetota bacterium]
MPRPMKLLSCLVLGSLLAAPASAEESTDYSRDLAQLREMLVSGSAGASRDSGEYSLDIDVGDLQRFLHTPPGSETGTVYHYVIFRLRNRIGQLQGVELDYSSHYNEVLAAIADEYRDVEVDGNALKVRSDHLEDSDLNVILDRSELTRRSRQVMPTIVAFDEDDTRMTALDDLHEGSQDRFNFDDEGRRDVALELDIVRKRIEEQQGRRLLLPNEIAEVRLQPYDPNRPGIEGFAQGEVFGIALFNDIDAHSDMVKIEFRGISNKTRVLETVHARDEVADYFNTRVLRRIYEVTYQRTGDEYARDLDRWERVDAGWVWDNTFQRLERRRDRALAIWFVDNIADAQNKPNQTVLEEFKRFYREQQQQHPELPDLKLGN